MATITLTSSRRARRMVMEEVAVIGAPVNLNALALAPATVRSHRSNAARRHSHRGENHPHAPAWYRPAARHRRGRGCRRPRMRRRELMFHPRQRRVSPLDLVGIEIGGRLAEIDHLETTDRD